MAGKLAVDHWVKTADGAIGRIRYIGKEYVDGKYTDVEQADVAIDNDLNETITLPVSELRRIPNPNGRTKVPIEGMPDQRPSCPFCDKPLRPDVKNTYAQGTIGKITRREFEGWRGYRIEQSNEWDKFCTLSCAWAFAASAFRAGYRIRRKK